MLILLIILLKTMKKNTLKPNEMVRITQYTIEGAPIIKDLSFSNNKLILKVDRSRDMYVNPNDSDINDYEIKNIYTKIIKDSIFYMIETTSGENFPIAEFSLN